LVLIELAKLLVLRSLFDLLPEGLIFEVFALSGSRGILVLGSSSHSLSLLFRVWPFRSPLGSFPLRVSLPRVPPLRFLPLQRLLDRGQPLISQGLPILGLLPPQRFTRSRGFSPPTVFRSYFIPVPLLGFLPSGSCGVRRAIDSFEPFFPLVVFRPRPFTVSTVRGGALP
jgi:hypothetical protein